MNYVSNRRKDVYFNEIDFGWYLIIYCILLRLWILSEKKSTAGSSDESVSKRPKYKKIIIQKTRCHSQNINLS